MLFTRYRARLEFRDKLLGGVLKDPKLIEAWLRAKAGLEDAVEVRQAMLRTLGEIGVDVRPDMTYSELVEASETLASSKQTTGFKIGEHGLYVEARQAKAMLKECTNVLFAGERWGPTKKGPKPFLAERVFVDPDKLWLGFTEPTGVELVVGHLTSPTGPRNTLAYHEYVEGATLECTILVVRDLISPEQWAEIWVLAQENGFGAVRSQGHGRFDVTLWERLN
jgi:hypothetical protein